MKNSDDTSGSPGSGQKWLRLGGIRRVRPGFDRVWFTGPVYARPVPVPSGSRDPDRNPVGTRGIANLG